MVLRPETLHIDLGVVVDVEAQAADARFAVVTHLDVLVLVHGRQVGVRQRHAVAAAIELAHAIEGQLLVGLTGAIEYQAIKRVAGSRGEHQRVGEITRNHVGCRDVRRTRRVGVGDIAPVLDVRTLAHRGRAFDGVELVAVERADEMQAAVHETVPDGEAIFLVGAIIDEGLAVLRPDLRALELGVEDEVGDAGHGVRAVARRGAAGDGLDVLQQHAGQDVHVDAAKAVGGHDAAAVEQDQRAVGANAVHVDVGAARVLAAQRLVGVGVVAEHRQRIEAVDDLVGAEGLHVL